jgi:hypothetical protein
MNEETMGEAVGTPSVLTKSLVASDNPPGITPGTTPRELPIHCMINTTAACQQRCRGCMAAPLIDHNPKYNLTLAQLATFLRAAQQSGHHFEKLLLNGPGEPLLWPALFEGLDLMHKSGVADRIVLTTNGLATERLQRLPAWVVVDQGSSWLKQPYEILPEGARGAVPCRCRCGGPSLYGDRIYPLCCPGGIALPGAPWVPVTPDFLASCLPNGQHERSTPACAGCWANGNIKLPVMPWSCEPRQMAAAGAIAPPSQATPKRRGRGRK